MREGGYHCHGVSKMAPPVIGFDSTVGNGERAGRWGGWGGGGRNKLNIEDIFEYWQRQVM